MYNPPFIVSLKSLIKEIYILGYGRIIGNEPWTLGRPAPREVGENLPIVSEKAEMYTTPI